MEGHDATQIALMEELCILVDDKDQIQGGRSVDFLFSSSS